MSKPVSEELQHDPWDSAAFGDGESVISSDLYDRLDRFFMFSVWITVTRHVLRRIGQERT